MFFKGKFRMSSVEGTVDDRGCHFVYLNLASRIRTNQLAAAVEEYNTIYSGANAMRLQAEPYQPAIVTMNSRRMEGTIWQKLKHDEQTGSDKYWIWSAPEDGSSLPKRKRTASSSRDEGQELQKCKEEIAELKLQLTSSDGEELRQTTLELELQKCKEEIAELKLQLTSSSGEELRQTTLELELQIAELKRRLRTTPVDALVRENAQLKRDLKSADKNSDSLSDELDKLRGMYEVLVMRTTNLSNDNAFLRSRVQPGDRISVLETELEELRRECWGYKKDLERREALKPLAVDIRVTALEEERIQLVMEIITLKRRIEEQAKNTRPYYPPPQTNHMAEAHLHEILALKKQFGVERDALNARLAAMHAELFMEDGEKWADFFKRRYYSQMVCDPETGEPRVCPLTGEARSRAAHYETERNEALAKLLELKQRMPSDETTALLGRAQEKARKFKRRYKFLKTYLHEHQYVSGLLDGFCDSDKGNASESDDDLRPTGPRCVVVVQDVGVPFGFAVRSDETMDD